MQFARVLRSVAPLRGMGSRVYCGMPDPLDLLTGIQKKEMLAFLAGDCDPFHIICVKRGPGTRERPNLIPSAFEKRMVGCVCDEHTMHCEWICVHQGVPKRCGCGYWFELCPVAPFI